MDRIIEIFSRYALIILLSLNSLWIFYLVFTPLTFYPAYFILNLFYHASIEQSTIIIDGSLITLIDACIAGAAYFLLAMLNLSTPMTLKKRIFLMAAEFSSFLFLNILRIIILSMLFIAGFQYFDQAHIISWHIVSGLFVIVIWLAGIKMLQIKEIPFYSDFEMMRSLSKKYRMLKQLEK